MTTPPDWCGVVFPQWQGAGDARPIKAGAEAVRSLFEGRLEIIDIPVGDAAPGPTQHGVRGLEALVAHAATARAILDREDPARFVLLGGDCSVEIVPVSFLNRKYRGRLGVLWLDAHADSNTPETSPSGHLHGMPLRVLQGELSPVFGGIRASVLRSDQVVLVGARDLDPGEERFVEDHAIPCLSAASVNEGDWDRLWEFLTARGLDPLYVHVDCDVLDPEQFPHVWYPTPGGVRPDRLVALLDALRTRCTVVGMSVLEYVPRGRGDPGTIRRLIAAGSGIAT